MYLVSRFPSITSSSFCQGFMFEPAWHLILYGNTRIDSARRDCRIYLICRVLFSGLLDSNLLLPEN